MAVSSLVQWFGGNRMHAEKVGQLMGKQDLIGIPFAGGLSELPFLQSRQILVNDKHSHLYDLYQQIMKNDGPMQNMLKMYPYHPQSLADAKSKLTSDSPFERSLSYFAINWLTRCSGGMEKEGEGSLAMRFTASGGSSIARWNSAVDGIPKWAALLRTKCECTCLDWREFRDKWNDRKGHGLYLDPPWIGAGDDYLHKFTLQDHRELSDWARSLNNTRVVVRHADCSEYQCNYDKDAGWDWTYVDAKNQAGNSTGEVLIRNRV